MTRFYKSILVGERRIRELDISRGVGYLDEGLLVGAVPPEGRALV